MERTTRGRPVFLYDGDCGFCTSSVRFIERHIPVRAEITPYQNADLGALGTTRDRASREVLWIDPDEPGAGGERRGRHGGRRNGAGPRVHGGAAAVARLLVDAGGRWAPLGRLIALPPLSWAAAAVYRLVSANRYRLPGGTPACAVGTPPPPPGDDRDGRRDP
jgi:predicted DCC family thiol-disulfide oxidoreductase YuxK